MKDGRWQAVADVPIVEVDGAVELVDAVEPAAVGMEGEMAGAGAGAGSDAGGSLDGAGGVGMDGEDLDGVFAEIAGEDEAIVGRDGGAVDVRFVLAVFVGAGDAAGGVVVAVEEGWGVVQRAAVAEAKGGEAATAVVGDECSAAGLID